jgi:hypothetical protein
MATILGLALACPLARAQDDADAGEAKKQYLAGQKAFSAGKFTDAAQAFEVAAALKPNAVALYTAALSWEQASQAERAADDYGRAIDMTSGGLSPQQTSTARERLVALEKVLGTIAITGPDGYKVVLDQFTESPAPVRLHGTGGTHSLSVRAPGKQPEKREIMLEGGQVQKLDVSPVAQATTVKHTDDDGTGSSTPKPVVVEKSTSHMSALKAVGFTAIGVGGAGVLGAILLGISAQDAGDAYNAAPSHAGLVHANALATWTTGVWIGAAVFVVAGLTFVLIPEKSATSPAASQASLSISPALGGFTMQGSF